MTVRSAHDYLDGVWDWAILGGCFGMSKITPTDIDGAVERNGKFLFIETKKPQAEISIGQSIFYEGLVNAGFSVLYVWGQQNQPCKLRLITPNVDRTWENADTDTFRMIVSKWYEWADKQPRRSRNGHR